MELKKINVVYVVARPQCALYDGLRQSATLHTLVVSGPEDSDIPEGVGPDWIVCCDTPIDIAIAPCLQRFYEIGHAILGLGSHPSELTSLVIDPRSSRVTFESALRLLQKVPRRVHDFQYIQAYQDFSIEDFIVLFERTINLRLPGSHERSDRVAWLAIQVGQDFGLSPGQIHEISVAARLREIGKFGLPDSLLFKDRSKFLEHEVKFYENYAALGASILRVVPELEEIACMIDYQLENVDGTGPSKLVSSKIPLGSRILRVCAAYERLEASLGPNSSKDVLSALWKNVNTIFDSDVLARLDSIVTKRDLQESQSGQHIPLHDLRPGMFLGQSVYGPSGIRLLAYGAMVTANRVHLIVEQLKRAGQREVVVLPVQEEVTADAAPIES